MKELNNPSWCCEQIQDKISEYKKDIDCNVGMSDKEKRILMAVIFDLERILYK